MLFDCCSLCDCCLLLFVSCMFNVFVLLGSHRSLLVVVCRLVCLSFVVCGCIVSCWLSFVVWCCVLLGDCCVLFVVCCGVLFVVV